MSFTEEAVRGALAGRGGELLFFDSCDSTNAQAASLGRLGVDEATVVADQQTGGRGRMGRVWQSPEGQNLYFSLLRRPALRPKDAPLLCLAAGVAVAEVLDLKLKWPNDVITPAHKKVCGLLAETGLRGAELDFIVLGVGVNVNQTAFPPELPEASSMALLGRPQERAQLLAQLVAAIDAAFWVCQTHPAAVLERWRRRAATLGQRVRVGELEGVAEDVRADGALMLRGPAGLQPVLAGDVHMVGITE